MRKFILATLLLAGSFITPAQAEDYVIDTEHAHAFIQFRVQHLGYSWLYGRFNEFSGTFSYDENNPAAASVEVDINPASIDTSLAERDKHLRDPRFLDVEKFPKAGFVSTSFEPKGDGKALLTGNFTLHGVTKPLTIEVSQVGAGKDPWGGFRRGFHGTTSFKMADYGMDVVSKLGPASAEVFLELSIEGVRK